MTALGETRQTTPDRAFAFVSLSGSALLVLGPYLTWDYSGGRAWTAVGLGASNPAGFNDGKLAVLIGLFIFGVSVARLSSRVPRGVLWAQLAVALFLCVGLTLDLAEISAAGSGTGPGIVLALIGAVTCAAGAFPLKR